MRVNFSNLKDLLIFNIKYYRYKNNISQEKLAELSKLSSRYLTDVDNLYFTDEVALGVMKSVIRSGKIAINNPFDYDARAALMLASSFSHNGLTGLGGNFYFTVHKLEHELSGTYDEIAHGAGLAALYSGWALTVYEKLPHKFARFAKEVMEVENNNELEAAKEGILKLRYFFK